MSLDEIHDYVWNEDDVFDPALPKANDDEFALGLNLDNGDYVTVKFAGYSTPGSLLKVLATLANPNNRLAIAEELLK